MRSVAMAVVSASFESTGVGEEAGKEEQFEAMLIHITRVEVIDPLDDGVTHTNAKTRG